VIKSGEGLWEPVRPRKPGVVLAVVALALVVVGVTIGVVQLNEALGVRYQPRADVCQAVDITALSTLASGGKPAVAPDPYVKRECQLQIAKADGLAVAVGRMTVTYGGNRLSSRIRYATYDVRQWTDRGGVGEEARTATDPGQCRFQLAVRDVNVVVEMTLSAIADEAPDLCAPGGKVLDALSATVRGTMHRLV
jgi:hypothetical protein